MTVSVYYSPPRTAKRTNQNWAVTIKTAAIADTKRFDTEEEAREYAAPHIAKEDKS